MNRAQYRVPLLPSRILVVGTTLLGILLLPLAGRALPVRKTVGDLGDFTTIQAALDDCASGITCQVDVEVKLTPPYAYEEHLVVPSSFVAGSITVTGGWDSTFMVRDEEPSLTTIDGLDTGGVVNVMIGGGAFTLEGFTVTGGSAPDGAGIRVLPTGASAATVKLVNLKVQDNHASSDGESHGGGVWAELDGTERLEVSRCNIRENTATVTSGTGAVFAAGLSISASGTATFLVEHSWVEDNTATNDFARKDGAGHFFSLIGDASGEVVNLRVTGNTASGTVAQVNGSGGYFYLTGNGQLVVRRSVWALNTDSTGDLSEQLRLTCANDTSLLITDSIVALGDNKGLYGSASGVAPGGAELQLVNLTVADNTLTGIELFEYDDLKRRAPQLHLLRQRHRRHFRSKCGHRQQPHRYRPVVRGPPQLQLPSGSRLIGSRHRQQLASGRPRCHRFRRSATPGERHRGQGFLRRGGDALLRRLRRWRYRGMVR